MQDYKNARIRTVAPTTQHPLLWALTDVAGLTPRRIRAMARLSTSTAHSLEYGRPVDADVTERLAGLLQWALDRIAGASPARRDVGPKARAYRAALFDLCHEILAEARRRAPHEPTSMLERDLVAAIGQGRRVDLVLSDLGRQYSRLSARRCARRIGVQTTLDTEGRELWTVPASPGDAPVEFAYVAPRPAPPKTPRTRKLHNAISIYLSRRPNMSATSREVTAAMATLGYSRPAVFRAARDMNLLRVVTGFGPTKTAIWQIPELRRRVGEPADTPPADVIAVDFTARRDE